MTSILRTLIGGAWRRRYLIIVPILVLSLVGLAAALSLPKTYSTRALILLQEQGGSNPLAQRDTTFDNIRASVAAIEALLKSERILTEIYLRSLPPGEDPPAESLDFVLQGLRGRIVFDVFGNQLVEISMRGSEPAELKRVLDATVEKLFSLLLLPSETTPSATDFLISKQTEYIEGLEEQLKVISTQAGDLSPQALIAKTRTRDQASAIAIAADAEAATAETSLADAVGAIVGEVTGVVAVDPQIAALRGRLEGADPDARAEIERQIGALQGLRGLETEAFEKRRVAEQARIGFEAAARALALHAEYAQRKLEIEEALRIGRVLLEEYQKRFKAQAERTIVILSAPDQLKLIDAPREPTVPSNSALLVLVLGVAAGIGLGCGLAIAAEQLDQSIRGEDHLASVTGLPVMARLPSLRPAEREILSEYGVGVAGLVPREAPPPREATPFEARASVAR